MNTRKRLTVDYPAVFWVALVATIVGGWMSVHAYKAMIHSDDALLRSIGMFVVLECVSIFAAATLNTRGQGLLSGLAFVLIFGCATTEIFLGASELQRGIMQMTETAKAASASTANDTANASALATAQDALKACQARYPRKKKDAQARTACAKPYEKSIAALMITFDEPTKNVEFDPQAAGMLALWQGITDAYNAMLDKEGEEAAKVERVAFIVMLAIFTVFVVGKLFLWSKYASWKMANDNYQKPNVVTVPEHAIGDPTSIAGNQAEAEPEPQSAKIPFGFTGNKSAAASSAERNRALYSSTPVTTGNCNKQVSVTTGNCNTGIQNSDYSTAYANARAAKVGHTVNCPNCGKVFTKANKWHTFCSNNRKPRADGGNCSDDYHNAIDPQRLAVLKALKRRK